MIASFGSLPLKSPRFTFFVTQFEKNELRTNALNFIWEVTLVIDQQLCLIYEAAWFRDSPQYPLLVNRHAVFKIFKKFLVKKGTFSWK